VKPRTAVVNDSMQTHYRYVPSEPTGKSFVPEFSSDLTPRQMLALGVFGVKYITDCRKGFPADGFTHASFCPGRRDPTLNFYGVEARQPLSVWREKGWIWPADPRRWLRWYCRYYLGRHVPDEDGRQIKRCKAMQRHIRRVEMNGERCDLGCRPQQRQALLQWAYDSRKI
jgi:hypothetical protein